MSSRFYLHFLYFLCQCKTLHHLSLRYLISPHSLEPRELRREKRSPCYLIHISQISAKDTHAPTPHTQPTHVRSRTHAHKHMHARTHARTRATRCTYSAHARAHAYTHTRPRARAHTHTHTYRDEMGPFLVRPTGFQKKFSRFIERCYSQQIPVKKAQEGFVRLQ